MKKTHWLRNTLIVLIACGLAGTVLAAVLFSGEAGSPYAASSIQFSFEGAADGKAPNGYAFDVSGLTSDEVLNEALETAGLAGAYTAEQVRGSLNVTGVYPEKIAEQMTKYVSLLSADAGTQAAVSDYHATQYSVTLYNDFDRNISSGKLTELLGAIMTAYRARFAQTYGPGMTRTEPITNLAEYDYAQQLEAISESVNQHKRYAEELAEMAPDFLPDQKGFGDIAVRYASLESDINRLNATITLNAVSKNRERLQKRYETEIRTQQYQLESLTEELKLIEAQVDAYDKDGIVYVSANGSLQKVGSDDGTYDKLVQKRKEVTDKIAEINAKIALYQSRLDDMTGVAAKAAQATEGAEDLAAAEELTAREKKQLQETVDKKLEALNTKKEEIEADFSAMLEAYTAREINEKTVSVVAVKYKAPTILSGAFAVKTIKTAGPLCAVGFMVCMVLLIISRRKEEKS